MRINAEKDRVANYKQIVSEIINNNMRKSS